MINKIKENEDDERKKHTHTRIETKTNQKVIVDARIE